MAALMPSPTATALAPWRQVDGHGRGIATVQSADGVELLGAQFDPADILHRTTEPSGFARTTICSNSRHRSAALGLQAYLELLVVRHRLSADPADRRLDVLRAYRIDHIGGRQPER